MKSAFLLPLVCASLLYGQPVMRANSVVNAASRISRVAPNYGIAQGALFIVEGEALGGSSVSTANSFPLGTTLGGTSMSITVDGTTVSALMVYVAPAGLPFGGDAPYQFLDAGPALNITGLADARQLPKNPIQNARTE